jgi:hypothetical protein
VTEYKITFYKVDPSARFDKTIETKEKFVIGDYTEQRIEGIAEYTRHYMNFDYYSIEKRNLHEKNEKLQVR